MGGGDGFVGTDLNTDPSVKSSYTIAMTAGAAGAGAPASCNGVAAGATVSTYFIGAAPHLGWWRAVLRDQPGRHHLPLHRGRRGDAERCTRWVQPAAVTGDVRLVYARCRGVR